MTTDKLAKVRSILEQMDCECEQSLPTNDFPRDTTCSRCEALAALDASPAERPWPTHEECQAAFGAFIKTRRAAGTLLGGECWAKCYEWLSQFTRPESRPVVVSDEEIEKLIESDRPTDYAFKYHTPHEMYGEGYKRGYRAALAKLEER